MKKAAAAFLTVALVSVPGLAWADCAGHMTTAGTPTTLVDGSDSSAPAAPMTPVPTKPTKG